MTKGILKDLMTLNQVESCFLEEPRHPLLSCVDATQEIQDLDEASFEESEYELDEEENQPDEYHDYKLEQLSFLEYELDEENEPDDCKFEEDRTQACLAEQQFSDQASGIERAIAFAKKLFKKTSQTT